jgi:hypothetical protein
MSTREDQAASKIQALHRGSQARRVVDEKRQRESSAATRIQSIQRGRNARAAAVQKRKELELFTLPPSKQTQEYVEVRMSLPALRQRIKSWDQVMDNIAAAELVPGNPTFDFDRITYSTTDAPESFANAFSRAKFEAIVAYDAARVLASKRRAEHEAVEAAKPPPPPPAPPRDEADDDEEPTSPTKTKKQLREEAEQRKADRERLKGVVEAEHDANCRLGKLANVLKLHTLRIPLSA